MRKTMFTFFASIACCITFAQTSVERILILNEGYYDYVTGEIVTPVTLGAYDPVTNVYTTLDEIENARFATDIRINGDYYYVAADKYLLKYDLYTDELVNSTEIEGIRKIDFWNDEIIVSRGEYMITYDAYIQVYDKNSLEFIFEITDEEIPHAAEGVVVKDDIAYIAVNNGFVWGGEVGYIATIDMISETLTGTIDLGPDGKNPDNLMIDGDQLYTLNNKDFTGSSVSTYKIGTGDISTIDLENVSAGCGTSVMFDGAIYYQEMFSTVVTKYQPVAEEIESETEFSKSFYAMLFDDVNGLMYASETDYFSYGKVNIYTIDGDYISSFDVSVSPGNMALDLRTTTAINETAADIISVYPNPTSEILHLNMGVVSSAPLVTIYNLNGDKMMEAANADIFVGDLPTGNYLVKVVTRDQVLNGSFSKL